ncbi:MAG: GFA family protein [Pseudomonadota bacterium]|nr:GFA family protein [Pseudomonadota bacterium]
MSSLSGQCLCGAVRFEVSGPLATPHACHSGQCRRQSGHHTASTHARRTGFSLTADRGLKWYRSSDYAERGFCGECGSSLLWDDGGDDVDISMGSPTRPPA